MVSDDKWQCVGCKETYSIDEENDGEENADYAEQFYCDECDAVKDYPYCGDCALYFTETQITICPKCLDVAMKDCRNIKGKVIEKVVEKCVYVKENSVQSAESMEDFEKRILGA